MRPELVAGAKLFNKGEYWEAHEAWELPWNAAKERGEHIDANYIQALILLAAAIHKCRHYHSPHGGQLNFEKASRRIANVPANYSVNDGFDLLETQRQVLLALSDWALQPQLPIG